MAVLRKIFAVTVLLLLMVLPVLSQAANVDLISAGVRSPVRVAAADNGSFYLTDPRAGAVFKYDLAGAQVEAIPFKKGQGIAYNIQSGDLIVGSGSSATIIGRNGSRKSFGQFKMADGIAIDFVTNYIYVVDSLDNCVQVFTAAGAPVNTGNAANGKPANSFGTEGSASGQFSMPTGVAFEKSSGQIVVADTLNGRVQFFDSNGVWKKSIGGNATAVQFTMPTAVSFGYDAGTAALKRMYVTDTFQSGVHVIDPAIIPAPVSFIGGYGKMSGKLMNPYDAAIDHTTSRLIVTNAFGNVSIWSIDGGGTLPALPTLTIDTFPSTTASSSIVISGTVDPNARLAITSTTALTIGTPVINGSFWNSQISGLQSGLNTITVTATNGQGVSASQDAAVTYNPSATALAIAPVITPTYLTAQRISGTTEAGATVTVSVSHGTAGTVSMSGTTWSCDLAGMWEGKINDITVTAAAAGKTSSSVNTAIYVKAPLQIFTAADGAYVSSQLLTVSGPVDSSVPKVKVNGTVAPVSGGYYSRGVLLAGATNTVTVVDETAGSSLTLTQTVNFDPIAPKMAITSPPAGALVSTTAPITVKGTCSGSLPLTLKMTGHNEAVNCSNSVWTSSQPWTPPGGGVYAITAEANYSGKVVTSSTVVTAVDSTKQPLASVSTPATDILTNLTTYEVIVTSATATSVTATVYSPGATTGTPLQIGYDQVKGYVANLNFTAEGAYLVAVTVFDVTGANSTVYRTIYFKLTAPALTVTAQSSTGANGTADPGSTVYINNASGVQIGTAVVSANGTWNISPFAGTATAPLNIYAIDAAGNNSRNGNLSGSGATGLMDALRAARIAVKLDPPLQLTSPEMLRGDVGPLVNGKITPDGKIDLDDVVVILMRIVGLI